MGAKVSKCEGSDPTILPPPPPPPGASGTVSPPPGVIPQMPEHPVSEKFKNNPGYYEDLHRKCKELFPVPFEGAKLVVNKALNQGFQVSHTIAMSSITPSGYRFGSTYVSSDMISPSEPKTVLLADTDPSGNMNAQAIIQPYENIRMKWASQILNNKFGTNQFSSDIRGKDWSAAVTLVNPNIFSESGIVVGQFLQGVTKNICLGAEIMFQKAVQIPGGSATLLSLSGRYTGDSSIWSGHMGSQSMGLCYYKKVNEELQVGIEVESAYQLQQTMATLGYQYELAKANFTMKAMVDTNWTVTGVFEKRLLPLPFLFSLCGSLNHVKNQFRLGCGLTIG